MSVRIPVSIGELIDKITILEIKLERFTDDEKRINVERELTELRKAIPAGLMLDTQRLLLKEINEELWEIMNHVSQYVGQSADSLVDHQMRRSELKREINEQTGSEIIEEKEYG